MALRTKAVTVAGHTVKIANLNLTVRRRYAETVEAFQKDKADVLAMNNISCEVVLSSLQRADPSFTLEKLEELFDGDDLFALFHEVMLWTGQIPGLVPSVGEAQPR